MKNIIKILFTILVLFLISDYSYAKNIVNKKILIVPGVSMGEATMGKKLPNSFIQMMNKQEKLSMIRYRIYMWGGDREKPDYTYKLLVRTDGLGSPENVTKINLKLPLFKTNEGIGVGSSLRKLKEKYPKIEKLLCLGSDSCWGEPGIMYHVTNGQITEILLYPKY